MSIERISRAPTSQATSVGAELDASGPGQEHKRMKTWAMYCGLLPLQSGSYPPLPPPHGPRKGCSSGSASPSLLTTIRLRT